MQTQPKTKDEKSVIQSVQAKKVAHGNLPQPLDLKAAQQVAGGLTPYRQW